MKQQKASEVSFYWLLLEVLVGRRLVADLLAHAEFLTRGERICRAVARDERYGWDELFQDVCVKVLSYGSKLCRNNIPDEEAFFRWLFTVALNCRRDENRKNGDHRKQEVWLSDILIEELIIMDMGISPEGNCLLKEFTEFIETLPENRRRAIKLRLDGCTYEKIAEVLTLQGMTCTNVTARKWCRDGLETFFGYSKEAVAVKVSRV